MSAPPGIARTTTLGCSTGSEDRIDKVIRAAHKALADSGVSMSPRRVNKIVRRFGMNARKHGMSFHEFLAVEANLTPAQQRYIAANPDLARMLAYPDPVGEEAVNNVMRRARTNKMESPSRTAPQQVPRISVEDLVPDPDELEDILVMAGVSDEQFEEALAAAKAEGDLSQGECCPQVQGDQPMIGPVRDQAARDALDDFGVFDDDRTEDLRRTAPVDPVLPAPAGTAHTQLPAEKKG